MVTVSAGVLKLWLSADVEIVAEKAARWICCKEPRREM